MFWSRVSFPLLRGSRQVLRLLLALEFLKLFLAGLLGVSSLTNLGGPSRHCKPLHKSVVASCVLQGQSADVW